MKSHRLIPFFATFIFCITVLFLQTTCTKDTADPGICFQEDVYPIFVSNCTTGGCHSGSGNGGNRGEGEGLNLTTYEGIMSGVKANHPGQSKVWTTISGPFASMPPGKNARLSSTQLKYIKIWINKGAPNSAGCRGCDSTQFTYLGRIQPLIKTWCVGCHNATTAGAGYNLSDYAGLLRSVSRGRLLGCLQHDAGFIPMPQGGGSLSACDMGAIRAWVNAGSPNN